EPAGNAAHPAGAAFRGGDVSGEHCRVPAVADHARRCELGGHGPRERLRNSAQSGRRLGPEPGDRIARGECEQCRSGVRAGEAQRMSTGVVVEELSIRTRTGAELLAPTSLRVEPGTITAITGPSGAGKTTLMRA